MKKYFRGPDRQQTTIRRMRNACWITKATNTDSEYVIFTAFPLQQWLLNSASLLRTLPALFLAISSLSVTSRPLLLVSKSLRVKERLFLSLCLAYLMCVLRKIKSHSQPGLTSVNFLKPTGHVMHQQFNIQQLYALPTLYLCVLYLSENKQRLVPLTA